MDILIIVFSQTHAELRHLNKMAYSLEFGQEGWTVLYGFKMSNNIQFNQILNDYHSKRGPARCETCAKDGSFEGVFYGLCEACSKKSAPCQCVYCRIAGVDGHKLVERRMNICKFIKELQTVIHDLKRDYPDDEYGIVKEGIESGFYILDLHTKYQYMKMENEVSIPAEVNQLSIGELQWCRSPGSFVPDTVICSAIVAAKRLNIWEWTKKMWLESCIDVKRYEDRLVKFHSGGNPANKILFCDGCGDAFIGIPDKKEKKFFCVKCIGSDEECEYCSECGSSTIIKELDERGYCLNCQHPDNDQGWPKGD